MKQGKHCLQHAVDHSKKQKPEGKNKRAIHFQVFEQMVCAVACSACSFIFTEVYLLKRTPDLFTLLATVVVIALCAAEYGYRWLQLITNQTLTPKRGLPVMFLLLLYGAVALVRKEYLLPMLAILCAISAALFLILDYLPGWIKKRWSGEQAGISLCSAKRLSVMIPMVFTAIHSTLFGGCIVLALQAEWWALVAYLPLYGYLLFWRKTFFSPREKCEPGNMKYLGCLCAVFFVYFCGQFSAEPKTLPWEGESFGHLMCLTAFSVFAGITISLPMLVDLLRLQKKLVPDADFSEKHRVLSVIACIMTGISYLTWVWIDFSYIFLLLFTIARAYWVHSVSAERGKLYGESGFWSLMPFLLMAGLLISELLGVWNSFGEAPIVQTERKWYHVLVIEVAVFILPNIEKLFGKDASKQPILERIGGTVKRAKTREIYMLFLFVISVILSLLKDLGLGKIERIQYAMQIIMLDAVMILFQFMVSFFADLTIKNRNRPNGDGKPSG